MRAIARRIAAIGSAWHWFNCVTYRIYRGLLKLVEYGSVNSYHSLWFQEYLVSTQPAICKWLSTLRTLCEHLPTGPTRRWLPSISSLPGPFLLIGSCNAHDLSISRDPHKLKHFATMLASFHIKIFKLHSTSSSALQFPHLLDIGPSQLRLLREGTASW